MLNPSSFSLTADAAARLRRWCGASLLLGAVLCSQGALAALKPGDKTPEFSAPSSLGGQVSTFSLSEVLKKGPVVLYFYPKDNTPGCTTEAMQFRDHHKEFVKAGAVVLGVSRDNMASHDKFKQNLELPFELIADTEEKLCHMFGVVKNKIMYGKKVKGIERSTFLIDAQGILREEWRGLKVAGHVEEVLKAVKALKKEAA